MTAASRRRGAVVGSLWVPLILFGFAALLAVRPLRFASPVTPPPAPPSWAIDPTPVRQPRARPEYIQAGFTYTCNACHAIIASPPETTRTLSQHREIVLEHGLNARCFNCHHPRDRNAFVDDAGGTIPWDEPYRLCARCHGTVFRDWEHGAHGRTNGYWDLAQGERTRLRCVQCHDPHRPVFGPLAPAPGPFTLRMGPQGESEPSDGHHPLRVPSQAAAHGAAREGHQPW